MTNAVWGCQLEVAAMFDYGYHLIPLNVSLGKG